MEIDHNLDVFMVEEIQDEGQSHERQWSYYLWKLEISSSMGFWSISFQVGDSGQNRKWTGNGVCAVLIIKGQKQLHAKRYLFIKWHESKATLAWGSKSVKYDYFYTAPALAFSNIII